jgi:hypothetical protein
VKRKIYFLGRDLLTDLISTVIEIIEKYWEFKEDMVGNLKFKGSRL